MLWRSIRDIVFCQQTQGKRTSERYNEEEQESINEERDTGWVRFLGRLVGPEVHCAGKNVEDIHWIQA